MGRRRGAVGGAGELETAGGGGGDAVGVSDKIDIDDCNGETTAGAAAKAKSPSTFWRLWSEAKHEKGHLALAGVCLLASSSANLMAPAIMAK